MNNEITYNSLLALVGGSGLTPGDTYQITDYSNMFDVIVKAESTTALGVQCTFTGTTVGVDFSKWFACYSIEPNTAVWNWETTKGVIYNLYDDKGNNAYFDFITTNIIDYGTCENVTIRHNPYVLPYTLPDLAIDNTTNVVMWDTNQGSITTSEYINIGENNTIAIASTSGATIGDNNDVTISNSENVTLRNNNVGVTISGGTGVEVCENVSGATIGGKAVLLDAVSGATVDNAKEIYIENCGNITINQYCNYIRVYNSNDVTMGANTTNVEARNTNGIETVNNTIGVRIKDVGGLEIDGTKIGEGSFIYSTDDGGIFLKNTTNNAIYTIDSNGDVQPTEQTYITEAPTDGQQYARQNAGWQPITMPPTLTAGQNITIYNNKINAVGYTYNSLTGNISFVDGVADAPGGNAVAIGGEAHGTNSVAIGGVAYGNNTTAIGYGTSTNTNYFTAMGKYNNPNASNYDCFQFGWGTSTSDRKNIFTITTGGTAWAETEMGCGGTGVAPAHKLTEKVTTYGKDWGLYTATQSATIDLVGNTNYVSFSGTTSMSAPTLNVNVPSGLPLGDYTIYVADAIRHNYAGGFINPILNIVTSLPIEIGYSGLNSTQTNPFMLVVHILIVLDATDTKCLRYYVNRNL